MHAPSAKKPAAYLVRLGNYSHYCRVRSARVTSRVIAGANPCRIRPPVPGTSADLAQLVEHIIRNDGVHSSIL